MIGAVLLVTVLAPVAVVHAGSRGVITTFGSPRDALYDPGLHFRWRIMLQTLVVAVFVVTSAVTALWKLMPASVRSLLATHMARAPLPKGRKRTLAPMFQPVDALAVAVAASRRQHLQRRKVKSSSPWLFIRANQRD